MPAAVPKTSRITLHYEEAGRGPTVVLLHGMTASTRYWHKLMSQLEADHRVIAIDLLGFGRSPKPKDASYSREQHIECIAATLKKLGVDGPFILVGHSMGALVALGMAVHYPRWVHKLVLIGTPVYDSAQEARERIAETGPLPSYMYWGIRARLMCATVCTRFRPVTQHLMPLVFRQLPPEVAVDTLRHTWQSYRRSMRHIIEEQDVPADLKKLRVPTVALFGTQDKISRGDAAETLARGGKYITVKTMPGSHQLPLEDPAAVAKEIRT